MLFLNYVWRYNLPQTGLAVAPAALVAAVVAAVLGQLLQGIGVGATLPLLGSALFL